ncbi:MAG TPA: MarR family transcriptional regulator [Lacunisphaera sp.]|nr:MarR family transcriptional regulator [Lacunisphaera sp.]
MTQQVNSNRQEVARHLMFVSGYVHRLLRHEARKLDLRWTALMVLKDLQLLGPVSQRTLAEIEQVTAPTMTVLINQMVQREWVDTESSAADARVSLVAITPAGRKALGKSGRRLRLRLEEELVGVPASDLDDLHQGLDALAAVIHGKVHNPKNTRPAQ